MEQKVLDMSKILKGSIIRDEVLSSLKNKIAEKEMLMSFAIISVGEDEASKIYIAQKIKMAEKLGIKCETISLDKDIQTEEVIKIIEGLNLNPSINGIIVQLPIPRHLDKLKIINTILPEKDIDGLTSSNLGKLINNEKGLFPATASGVMVLLDYYNIDVEGKRVLIINRSTLVGKPLSLMMLNKSATVTIAHSKTKKLNEILKDYDLIVSAVGVKDFIKKEYISDDSILIDIGVCRIDNKIYGDVESDIKKNNISTPTIGGVGPLTIAMLATNIVKAFEIQNGMIEE